MIGGFRRAEIGLGNREKGQEVEQFRTCMENQDKFGLDEDWGKLK